MTNSSKPKVYQGILEELRGYIKDNDLSPGDKLPSERELAEKLQAGRSSIREALRALELLGLIETKRGEGTFLRTYQSFQSVELLSSFILLEGQTRDELFQAKQLIEKEAAKLALPGMDKEFLSELESCLNSDKSLDEKHIIFFTLLLRKTDNQLLLKIWMLMEEFSRSLQKPSKSLSFYKKLLKILSEKDFYAIEGLYEQQDTRISDK